MLHHMGAAVGREIRGDQRRENENIEKVSQSLAEILGLDYEEVKSEVTKEQSIVKIEQGVDKDTADKIRDADLPGVEIAEDTKRSYPLGAFASHTLERSTMTTKDARAWNCNTIHI